MNIKAVIKIQTDLQFMFMTPNVKSKHQVNKLVKNLEKDPYCFRVPKANVPEALVFTEPQPIFSYMDTLAQLKA